MNKNIIIMGVCGTGKTTIGQALAAQLKYHFYDGDDLHPSANIEKMRAGKPLNDQDRQPWLECIRDQLQQQGAQIIACSALKRAYRDILRQGNPNLVFLFLEGSKALISQRMQERSGHFMQATMLDSQLATLERPTPDEVDVFKLPIEEDIAQLLQRASHVIRTKARD